MARSLTMAIASLAALSVLLVAPPAERAEAAVTFSGSPAAQTAGPDATGISVSIVAADIPVDVAFAHFVVAYDSSLLKATGATCGSALAGTFALTITSKPGIADIGCFKIPPATIYNGGTQTVATVTFDALGTGGTSIQTLIDVELLDEKQACIQGHGGSRCTAPGSADALGSITLGAAASSVTPAASSATPAASAATPVASTATPAAKSVTPAAAASVSADVNAAAGAAREPGRPSPSSAGQILPAEESGAAAFPVAGHGTPGGNHTDYRMGLGAVLAAAALFGALGVRQIRRRKRPVDGGA